MTAVYVTCLIISVILQAVSSFMILISLRRGNDTALVINILLVVLAHIMGLEFSELLKDK